MAVRKIIRMGHPTLRKPARRLEARELASPEMGRLVNDMIDTLNDSGGIGLAAPQIDEPVRLAIIEIAGGTSRYGEIPAMPLTVALRDECSAFARSMLKTTSALVKGVPSWKVIPCRSSISQVSASSRFQLTASPGSSRPRQS